MDDEAPRIGDNSLRAIDPHKLLVIEGYDIPLLLDAQYPDLAKRSDALLVAALDWITTTPIQRLSCSGSRPTRIRTRRRKSTPSLPTTLGTGR